MGREKGSGKKQKKVQVRKPRPQAEKSDQSSQEYFDEESNRNQYGGFPNRDLKKNLGCG